MIRCGRSRSSTGRLSGLKTWRHRLGGESHPWGRRHEAVAAADLALVATGASEPVIHDSALPSPGETTLLVDVAMPRNVDPASPTARGTAL
jgi:Glutamyl-tRNA reductase